MHALTIICYVKKNERTELQREKEYFFQQQQQKKKTGRDAVCRALALHWLHQHSKCNLFYAHWCIEVLRRRRQDNIRTKKSTKWKLIHARRARPVNQTRSFLICASPRTRCDSMTCVVRDDSVIQTKVPIEPHFSMLSRWWFRSFSILPTAVCSFLGDRVARERKGRIPFISSERNYNEIDKIAFTPIKWRPEKRNARNQAV